MTMRPANPKRFQYTIVALVHGLGLLCVLHFTWVAILDLRDLLHEQSGQIAFSYGKPLPFFRTQYRPRYVTILRTSTVQPMYRESIVNGIQVDGPFNALAQLEPALGLAVQDATELPRFARSDFVIGIILPSVFILFALLMQCWAIRKGTFSWWEAVISAVIVSILMAMLAPVAARSRHYSEYTYQTWKALTLPPGATVLAHKKDDAKNSQVLFVLYRLAPSLKTTVVCSSGESGEIAEGGDYVVVAIADGKESYRALAVTSKVVFPSSATSVVAPRLKILQRISNTKNDFVFLSPGAGLPNLRYDSRKFTWTTVKN